MKSKTLLLLITVATLSFSVVSRADCQHGICAGNQNANDPVPPSNCQHGICAGNQNANDPAPYYPPAPSYTTETMECDSYDSSMNTCSFDSSNVTEVDMIQEESSGACFADQTYGIQDGQVWVSNGCQALFQITRQD